MSIEALTRCPCLWMARTRLLIAVLAHRLTACHGRTASTLDASSDPPTATSVRLRLASPSRVHMTPTGVFIFALVVFIDRLLLCRRQRSGRPALASLRIVRKQRPSPAPVLFLRFGRFVSAGRTARLFERGSHCAHLVGLPTTTARPVVSLVFLHWPSPSSRTWDRPLRVTVPRAVPEGLALRYWGILA